MKFNIIKTVGILLLIISAVFSLFAKNVLANNKKGGIIRLSLLSPPKSFNPIVSNDAGTALVTGLIFEGLLKRDATNNEMYPALAEKFEVSEDGLIYTFYLRENLKWSDGEMLTADDVVFTFNDIIYNPKIPSSTAAVFFINKKPIKVTKIDTLTIKMELPQKFAPFLISMSQAILPKHILAKNIKSDTFSESLGVDAKFTDIVGAGPYKLFAYDAGQSVTLIANPNYYKKDDANIALPYIEKIEFLITRNADTALLAFKEGLTDFYGMRGSDFPILKPLEKQNNFTVYRMGASLGSSFLGFNVTERKDEKDNFILDEKKRYWFANVNFRKAALVAIDRQSIIDIAYNGLAHIQHSPLSPAASDFYNPDVIKYEYNPQKARKILTDCGFIYKDNKLFDDKGNRVEFNLLFASDSSVVKIITGMLRQDFAEIGISVNLQQVEFNTLVSKLTATCDWDAVFLSLTGSKEPHFGANVWMSDAVLHFWNPNQKVPRTAWEAEIDEIFSEGVTEIDKEKRKIYYNKWQEIVADKLPLLYLVIPESIVAVKNKFANIKPVAAESLIHNIEEIYIK